jgi:hypothetical protein
MKFLEYLNSIKLLNDIYDDFQENKTINKKELLELLPKQYKTKAKLDYINKLGDDITEEEFVGLLLIQTHDYDYINYEYFILYYGLKLDNNNMIIFNDKFTYTMCKMERLYIWWIIKNLQLHPMFSKFMDSQLQYTLQRKLENKIFSLKDNFKYDLSFNERNIGIEINENHHSKAAEKKKDWQKVSLAKFHGIAMISLITDKCDNITNFVKDLYKDKKTKKKLCKEIISKLDLPETIDLYDHISDLVQSGLLSKIGRSASKTLKKDIKNFKQNNKSYIIVVKKCINDLVDQYVKSHIYNSSYLTEFLENLKDYLLCSLLSDYEFRQEYIEKVFLEELISMQEKRINKVKNITNQTDKKYFTFIKEKFDKIHKICIELNSKTYNDCVKLFDYKKRSLENPNELNVISITELSDLCAKENNINEFIIMIEYYCDLENINKNSLITWKDINIIFNECDVKEELRDTLLLYYREIEVIYENIIRRISAHSLLLTSTSDDYDNYMNRIKKKTVILEKRAITKFANKCIPDGSTSENDIIKNTLNDSVSRLDKQFKEKLVIIDTNSKFTVNYNNDDLYMIGLSDNETRINNVYRQFYAILSSLDSNTKIAYKLDNDDN